MSESADRRAAVSGNDIIRPTIVLCVMFFLLVWPCILLGGKGTSEASDHQLYHAPVIQTFAEQWPHVDLVNYQSATAPGYHLLLAVFTRYGTDNQVAIQLLSSLFSLGLILVVFVRAANHIDGWFAMMLVSPLLLASHFVSGAIWLTTDNAAWMFVALALGPAAMIHATPVRALRWGIYAACAVFIRQIHVWVSAPVALALLLYSPLASLAPSGLRCDATEPQRSAFTWIIAAISVALPLVIVGWLAMMWGGLMPPMYADLHNRGANLAFFPMTLSLIGIFGVFFLPAFGVVRLADVIRHRSIWIAAILGVALALLVPTSFSIDEGCWGGALWSLVQRAPVVADRSIVLPPLAALGASILVLAWQAIVASGNVRAGTILLCGFACWAAAQSMNSQVWQRYSEPLILIMLIWLASLARSKHNATNQNAAAAHWIVFPMLLGAMQLALTALTVYLPIFRTLTS